MAAAISAVGSGSIASLASYGQAAAHSGHSAADAAQTAVTVSSLAAYRQTTANLRTTSDPSLSPASASRLRFDLTALGAALSVGDLKYAQSAFTTVQGDLRHIPSQLLYQSDIGFGQTVQHAQILIQFLNSISQSASQAPAAQQAASALAGQSSSAQSSATTGAIIDVYA